MEIFLSIALVMSLAYNILQAVMLDGLSKVIEEDAPPF